MTLVTVNDSATAQDIEEDRIGKIVVDAAFFVHKTFGPGLLESVYEACLIKELRYRGLMVESQKVVPVYFRDEKIDLGFRLDLLIENKIIIEVKAIEKTAPVHDAQLLTYMKLMDLRLGYIINFNSPLIKDGIKRMVRRT